MIRESHPSAELFELLEALCEQRLTTDQMRRLEEIVVCDRDARRTYLEYVELHGTLYWDTAIGDSGNVPLPGYAQGAALPARAVPIPDEAARTRQSEDPASLRWPLGMAPRHRTLALALTGMGLTVLLGVLLGLRGWLRPEQPVLAANPVPAPPSAPSESDVRDIVPAEPAAPVQPDKDAAPEMQARVEQPTVPTVAAAPANPPAALQPPPENDASAVDRTATTKAAPENATENIVEFVNAELKDAWGEAGVRPSSAANDSEWIRRVSLDLLGHIPSADRVGVFLADKDEQKRERLVEEFLASSDFTRHWANVWTNLLIGRSEIAGVDRPALEDFLRDSFAANRPWSDVVSDLISAEGDSRQNGATNFLLAHLNNQAVPATAITARILMGVQVQCTQCHNHPFNRDQQDRFWELHSFFQQTAVVRHRTGGVELVSRQVGGPSFFETLKGITRVAYPKFGETSVDPGPEVNRRRQLASLMTHGDCPLVAVAMVNRTWEHFFGHGFTRPVDDMGPHNPPTHPELLDRLSRAFVASGFDTRQLLRWIVSTEAYQLSSQFGESNQADEPSVGESPLFSRMYLKAFTAEQLYDSLIVATDGEQSEADWSEVDANRRRWMAQFVVDNDTEENNEITNFEGTVSQALMMMNGDLMQGAVGIVPGSFLNRLLADKRPIKEKVEQLFLSALSRYPSRKELDAATQLVKHRQVASAYQDLFWAALNSNEFIVNH